MSTILVAVTDVVKNLDDETITVTTEETGIYVVIERSEGEDTYLFQRRVAKARTALSSEGIACISGGIWSTPGHRDSAALAVTSVD